MIKAAFRAGVVEIVGTGPEEDELKAMPEAQSDRIRFMRRLEKLELRAAIQRARAVVLLSRWYENAPMSILEAYANGQIVIGANIGGIPELIRPGETGHLFEVDDVEGLAALLEKVCAQKDHDLLAMGQQARQWVLEQFDCQRYSDSMVNLYASLNKKVAN